MKRSPSASLEICIFSLIYALRFILYPPRFVLGSFKPSATSASARNLLLSPDSTRRSFQSLWCAGCLRLEHGAIHRSLVRYVLLPFLAFFAIQHI
jgi:hypothetical protein